MTASPDPAIPKKLQEMLATALAHHQAGRLIEAERIYRQILAADARHADSLHLLGLIEHRAGRLDAAAELMGQAIAADPSQEAYHSNLGTVLQSQGKLDKAAASYRRALALKPDLAEAHINLGGILQTLGTLDEAAACLKRGLAMKPGLAEGFYNLGNVRQAQGRLEEAIECQKRALTLRPDYVDAHNNIGTALAAQGRTEDAIAHYERALELNPRHFHSHNNLALALVEFGRNADAIVHYQHALDLHPDDASVHGNLGLALMAEDRLADAIAHYQRALELNPSHSNVHNNFGIALARQGRIPEAIAHYERALALNPEHGGAHNNLGNILSDQEKLDEAAEHYQRALAIDPNHAEALNNLGNVFRAQGRFGEALAHYGRAIEVRPDYAEAHLHRSEMKTFHRGDPDLAVLEALAVNGTLPAKKAAYVHFALAKALDDVGDYPRAFERLRIGNALKRSQIQYDEAPVLRMFQRISTVFGSDLFERMRGSGDPSSIPIFVLGMPRSGSTLVEQILANHPQIHAAGELEQLENTVGALTSGDPPLPFPECVPLLNDDSLLRLGQAYLARLPAVPDGTVRIIDKLPGNFLSIGLIRLILPNARIIHTLRDPMDTCLSCYSKLFTTGLYYTYDLAEMGRYYRCYTELMAHWRSVLPAGAMLEVRYEDVVDDLEGQARRMIEYCGLPWDGRCIEFHRANRPVKTASAVQVRQPLFRDSVQRWRRYEAGLAPLLAELAM